jgi:hypothetical protein
VLALVEHPASEARSAREEHRRGDPAAGQLWEAPSVQEP